MQILRELHAGRINSVVNHPSVRPEISLDDSEIDLAGLVADQRNIVLMDDSGLGGTIFTWVDPGVYELHTQFVPEGRHFARRFVVSALEYLFLLTDAMELFTRVPRANLPALKFTRSFGPTVQSVVPSLGPGGVPGETLVFRMTIWDWTLSSDAKPCLERITESLELPPDPFIGATLRMIFSPGLAKGLTLYSRYARVSGFPAIRVLGLDPTRIDLAGRTLEGLPCQ